MNRRSFLISSAAVGRATLCRSGSQAAGAKKRLKITQIKIYRVSIGGRNPVLVQVFTDAGISGVGEAAVAYGTGAPAGWSFRSNKPSELAREAERVVKDGYTALKNRGFLFKNLQSKIGHLKSVILCAFLSLPATL